MGGNCQATCTIPVTQSPRRIVAGADSVTARWLLNHVGFALPILMHTTHCSILLCGISPSLGFALPRPALSLGLQQRFDTIIATATLFILANFRHSLLCPSPSLRPHQWRPSHGHMATNPQRWPAQIRCVWPQNAIPHLQMAPFWSQLSILVTVKHQRTGRGPSVVRALTQLARYVQSSQATAAHLPSTVPPLMSPIYRMLFLAFGVTRMWQPAEETVRVLPQFFCGATLTITQSTSNSIRRQSTASQSCARLRMRRHYCATSTYTSQGAVLRPS